MSALGEEEVFERSLLEAAQVDRAPRDIERAWDEFSRALRSATASIDPNSGLHRIPRSPAQVESAMDGAGSRLGFAKAFALLASGAIGGSVITAGVVWTQHGVDVGRTPIPQRGSVSMAVASISRREPPLSSNPSAKVPLLTTPSEVGDMRMRVVRNLASPSVSPALDGDKSGPHKLAREALTTGTSAVVPEEEPSALAREVLALDSIRNACRAGTYAEALRLVANYHEEFPKGALSPDADVMALEALAERRDFKRLASEAARFLVNYPDDPHASKVRQWAELAQSHTNNRANDP